MPPPVFSGVSLKMYFDHQQTLRWAEEIVARSEAAAGDGVEVVLLPSFPSLEAVARPGVHAFSEVLREASEVAERRGRRAAPDDVELERNSDGSR